MNEQPPSTLIHNIELNPAHPTILSFDQLYSWVIWQFSQHIEGGLSGAVRPPIPDTGWYPALIEPKEKRVQIYGHLDTSYSTPEEAAKKVLEQVIPSK